MKYKLLLLALCLGLSIEPSYAMHIMEGYLPLGWCAFWYAVSIPFVVVSYRHIRRLISKRSEARIGFALNTAFVFVLSALKLPSLTGSSSHLTGTTLGTLTTGVMSMPLVGFVVLIFQALLLAHGGISTLGANIFSLAVVGPCVAYLVYTSLNSLGLYRSWAIFLAAALGSLSTYVTTALQLAVVFPDSVGGVSDAFVKFLSIFAITQVPLALVEGLMTVLVLRLLPRLSTSEPTAKPLGKLQTLGVSIAVLACLALPILAGYTDFGEGTDDLAGQMAQQLNSGYEATPLFSLFEPSEYAEPWLFVLQVTIGLSLFVGAIYYARKRS